MTGGPNREAPRAPAGDAPAAPAAGPERQRARDPGRKQRKGKNPDRGFLIAGAVVKPLMRVWFRIRVEGGDNVPATGPVILASNHRSNMDPVLLASALRRPVAFMAKAELFVGPLGWIMRWIGQFPVRRGGIDREALRRTDAVLARGSMLGPVPGGDQGRRGVLGRPSRARLHRGPRSGARSCRWRSSAPSGYGAGSAGCRSRRRSGS